MSSPRRVERGESEALSSRQREILSLLQQGKSNKEIAHALGIGVGTVKQHLVVLFKKMGVRNRAMAVSKSFALLSDVHNPESGLPITWRGRRLAEGMLERRAVSVLSLQVRAAEADLPGELLRGVQSVCAETALDFDAVSLFPAAGRCDMVFGVRQHRSHDVLRTVRAAVSISERIRAGHGDGYPIRAGVASGLISIGIGTDGAWNGEVIGGGVITEARGMMQGATAGGVAVHSSAAAGIAELEIALPRPRPVVVPLSRRFRWHHVAPVPPAELVERGEPLTQLCAALPDRTGNRGMVVALEGEGGMGKTALARTFLAQRDCRGRRTEVWHASIPGGQPSGKAAGRLTISGDSGESCLPGDLFNGATDRRTDVVVIEDCHRLSLEGFQNLLTDCWALADKGGLAVVTRRGRMAKTRGNHPQPTRIRLGHLTEQGAQRIVDDHLGAGHPQASEAIRMAAGVPGFLHRLCRHIIGYEGSGTDFFRAVPPVEFFSLVLERVDAHGLDRRLLLLIAGGRPDVNEADLLGLWDGDTTSFRNATALAVASGLVQVTAQGRRGERSLAIAHPLVKWVLAFCYLGRDQGLR